MAATFKVVDEVNGRSPFFPDLLRFLHRSEECQLSFRLAFPLLAFSFRLFFKAQFLMVTY